MSFDLENVPPDKLEAVPGNIAARRCLVCLRIGPIFFEYRAKLLAIGNIAFTRFQGLRADHIRQSFARQCLGGQVGPARALQA